MASSLQLAGHTWRAGASGVVLMGQRTSATTSAPGLQQHRRHLEPAGRHREQPVRPHQQRHLPRRRLDEGHRPRRDDPCLPGPDAAHGPVPLRSLYQGMDLSTGGGHNSPPWWLESAHPAQLHLLTLWVRKRHPSWSGDIVVLVEGSTEAVGTVHAPPPATPWTSPRQPGRASSSLTPWTARSPSWTNCAPKGSPRSIHSTTPSSCCPGHGRPGVRGGCRGTHRRTRQHRRRGAGLRHRHRAARRPGVRIWGVETEGARAMSAALASGGPSPVELSLDHHDPQRPQRLTAHLRARLGAGHRCAHGDRRRGPYKAPSTWPTTQ
jgi:hypothetical protein